eukprot:scaffold460_cov391-Pavlova_lutheri.AAC.1
MLEGRDPTEAGSGARRGPVQARLCYRVNRKNRDQSDSKPGTCIGCGTFRGSLLKPSCLTTSHICGIR